MTTPPENPGAPRATVPDLSDLLADPGKPPRPADPRRRRAVLAAAGGVALLALGGAIGYLAAPRGPATLAAAVQQAQSGTLPCGSTPSTASPANGAGGGRATVLLDRLCQRGNGTAPAPGSSGPVTARGGLGALFGPGALTGTVTTAAGGSVTVQTRAGNVTVSLPPTATIRTTTAGTAGDLKAGETVVVQSTPDASGSRTATSVLVLPAGGTGG